MNLKTRLKRMQRQVGERGDPAHCHCPPAYIVSFAGRGGDDARCVQCGKPRAVCIITVPGTGLRSP